MKKSQKILRHSLNYVPVLGEVNNDPSETVPDMSMSIKEIMTRYAHGRPLSVNNNLHYTGDDFYPDVKTMDFTEIDEMRIRNIERINELEKQRAEELENFRSKRREKRKKLDKILEQETIRQIDLEESINEIKQHDQKNDVKKDVKKA